MTKRDYYEILEITRDANEGEIKKAYRKMALRYHPDKNPGDHQSEEKFKEAAEAYEILNDSDKRQRYDRFGHAGVRGQGGGGYDMSMEDIFSNFGDIFGSAFGGFSGGFGNGSRRRRVNRGSNLRVRVKLSLEEIANGVNKKIKVNKYKKCEECSGSGAKGGSSYSTCSTCHGSGQVTRVTNTFLGQMQTASTCPACGGEGQVITSKCTSCNGDGIVRGEEVVSIDIPAGVAQDMQLSVSGKGNAGARGGINGDLIVVIEEAEHESLIRDGDNLIYNHFITYAEAALGATAYVPTLDGKAKLSIEAGTHSGKVLRLKGKGIPHLQQYGRGDLLVNISVWTPQSLSREERELLQQLDKSDNFKPNPSKSQRNIFNRMKEYFQ
ncbi:MAG: molecular chaperone DnaJ [Clostridia bacterium]|nr:molecular chaperone DnaJ [Clostridia bacterium]